MDEEIKYSEQNTVDETAAAAETEYETVEDDEALGTITVAMEVVSTIASMAVEEIKGVRSTYTSFAGGIAERLGSKKNTKGVKIEMKDSSVCADLYIIVDYGIKIPELAWEIQENVKSNIETMTGLTVEKVNIHIEGIYFPADDKPMLTPSQEAEEAAPEEDAPEEEIVIE